jgi:hypothetical protein
MPDVLRFLCLSLLLAAASPCAAAAADPLLPARRALAEGQPLIAAARVTRRLDDTALVPGEARQQAAALAVEAWVRAGDGARALEVLAREEVPGAPYWEAQAALLTGEVSRAEAVLTGRLDQGRAEPREKLLLARLCLERDDPAQARELADSLVEAGDPTLATPARLLLAEALLRGGEPARALSFLEKETSAVARHLRARALVDLDRATEAEILLEDLLDKKTGGEDLAHASILLLAEARLRTGAGSEAVDNLTIFLDTTPHSDLWPQAFELLARALEEGATPLPDAALRWVADSGATPREMSRSASEAGVFRGHALFLLARWLQARDRGTEALGLLEAMIESLPGHPQEGDAMRMALQIYGVRGDEVVVAALTARWRQRFEESGPAFLDFVSAGGRFVRGEFAEASTLFQAAADAAATLAGRRAALYNAGIAALRAGEFALYQGLLGQLQIVSAGSEAGRKAGDSAADLELDRALALAADGQPGAASGLNQFLQNHVNHPRALEACLALAELSMLAAPANFAMAEKALAQADVLPGLDEAQLQRIALTRLWLLDRRGELKTLAEQGTAFLKSWPEAERADEVRMKIGDAFFRLENFAAARTEFELLPQEHPESPYADSALYFAALSASATLTEEGQAAALELWQTLAERGGPLGLAARHQQAQVKRLAGREAEALNLIESLLAEKDMPVEMRRQLICEKAELLTLIGRPHPERLEEAVTALRSFLSVEDLPYLWRARAGHTLATVLHTAGRTTEALEACHEVVNNAPIGGPANPAEFRWFYRAGFFGIELLESARQWESAARLAEKLGRPRGERAAEAAERATKIRLDHFIWDEKK